MRDPEPQARVGGQEEQQDRHSLGTHTDPEDEAETDAEAETDHEGDMEEELQPLACLSTIPHKLTASVLSLTGGATDVWVDRSALLAPLTKLGIGNVGMALEPARFLPNYNNWVVHNGEKGAAARISATEEGYSALLQLFDHNQRAFDLMKRQILSLPALASPPSLAQTKRVRRAATSAASAPAAAARGGEVEVDATVVEMDEDEQVTAVLSKLVARVEAILDKFDDSVDEERMARVLGNAFGIFYVEKKRMPSDDEAQVLHTNVRDELRAEVVLGHGRVTRVEVVRMLERVQAAAELPALVKALEGCSKDLE